MRINLCLPLLAVGSVLVLARCASDESNGQPIPGTVESTNSKTSENNTPRVNPTPNPEPDSQPPDAPR
jgi:hypothetical protein